MTQNIITIDGPSGAGKSTICKKLAALLNMDCLDTGAMYRVVAWYIRKHEKEDLSGSALALFLTSLYFEIEGQGQGQRVWVEGEEISQQIRTPEISLSASLFSMQPEVRTFLAEKQRALGEKGGLVAEGRDMGTVIFPQARYKFFLTAEVSVRAYRRYMELLERGQKVSLEKVRQEMEERDFQDEQRALAPLRPAPGAIIIDSSGLSIEEVVEKMGVVLKEGKFKELFD
ncbi:MAG TPA: (d)CMP kinase [Thermodesulfobacteriota bacterium]|nr:(d)CMP kinase [Thermodesulfobacteriota bacterium]